MAKPTANTELGGAKIVVLADSTTVTPAARTPAAIQSSASGEATYTIGWQGIATHRDGDALTSPGGFAPGSGGVGTAAAPCVLIAGQNGSNVDVPFIATTTPGASDPAIVVRLASSTGTAIGTVAISSPPTSAGTSWFTRITDATNTAAVKPGSAAAVGTDPSLVVALSPNSAVPAGAATIGAVREAGWDHASLAPQRGLSVGTSNTTENTILAVSPGNIYNVMDVTVGWFGGTASMPTTATYLSFRHGVAGTEFLRVYLPIAIGANFSDKYTFKIPSRGAAGQAVTVQLNQAGGTGYQYSVSAHAYLTTT